MGWGTVAFVVFVLAVAAVAGWALVRRARGGREAGPVEPWPPGGDVGDADVTAPRRSGGS
jgi:hypothetical protein